MFNQCVSCYLFLPSFVIVKGMEFNVNSITKNGDLVFCGCFGNLGYGSLGPTHVGFSSCKGIRHCLVYAFYNYSVS